MDFLFDYTTLRLIWWSLLGLLFWGFALMDGFDLGVAILLPFAAKKDTERRVLINTVGPVWEGNQVWLILGTGAVFAAWPLVYSVLATSLYFPLFGVLCALILRPVAFKFRSRIDDGTWRLFWDGCLFIGGLIPALSFGFILGKLVSGLPFYFDDELRLHLTPSSSPLVTPFVACSSALWVFLFAQHGGLYLLLKTEGVIIKRIYTRLAPCLWASNFLFLLLLSLWKQLPHMQVTTTTNGPSDPLLKTITFLATTPAENVMQWLPLEGFPVFCWLLFLIISLSIGILIYAQKIGSAFVLHGVLLAVVIAFMGGSHFPLIIFSNTHPAHSLTIWDASSSLQTLQIMLGAVALFLPLILFYTTWAYRVFWGRVSQEAIHQNSQEFY